MMHIKEYETLARDLDERHLETLYAMEQVCVERINQSHDYCNKTIAAYAEEYKKMSLGLFVAGIFVGAIIAAVLLKV